MQEYGIAAFRSRQAVLRFEEQLRNAGVHTTIVTTPRAIAMGCGLSVRMEREGLPLALQMQSERPVDNFIGIYAAKEQDGKIHLTPIGV